MIQIVIKHLKWTLFIRFLRKTFSLLTSGWLLLLTTSSLCCKAQHSSIVNIYMEFSMTWVQTSEMWFLNPCWWKRKDSDFINCNSYCITIVSLYLTILCKKSELWDKKLQLPFLYYSVAETNIKSNIKRKWITPCSWLNYCLLAFLFLFLIKIK